jgi:hypothetical protein
MAKSNGALDSALACRDARLRGSWIALAKNYHEMAQFEAEKLREPRTEWVTISVRDSDDGDE